MLKLIIILQICYVVYIKFQSLSLGCYSNSCEQWLLKLSEIKEPKAQVIISIMTN